MKLKVQVTFTFDTDCFVEPDNFQLNKKHLEECIYLHKINDDYVEDLEITVIDRIAEEDNSSSSDEFFDACDREGDQS